MKLVYPPFVLVLIALALAGCGSGSQQAAPTPDANLLPGSYSTTIVEDDLIRFGSAAEELKDGLGTWVFTVAEDGKFVAELNGGEMGRGKFNPEGERMAVGILQVCQDCPCDENIGRYLWTASQEQLTFHLVHDPCEPLVLVLTSHPLKRIK